MNRGRIRLAGSSVCSALRLYLLLRVSQLTVCLATDSDEFSDSGISSNGSDAGSRRTPTLEIESEMERTVTNNSSDHGSIMLNARIGPDTYKDLTKLTINSNKADNGSIMVNYPNEKEDIQFVVELQMRREVHAWQLKSGKANS